MDAERMAVARACLDGAHDGSLAFGAIVARLTEAGFEGYLVDFRRGCHTCYLPDGRSVTLDLPETAGSIAAGLDAAAVAALVRWAQANGPDYGYKAFCAKVKAAGCAGYLVSFPGRRVLYFGRTAEIHVEHFPS